MTKSKSAKKTTKKAAAEATPEAKPVKAAKEKKAKAPKEGLVVFAIRLTQAERDAIHAAAGPRGATRYVRAVANAFAAGDESAFVELLKRYQLRLLRLAQATVGSRAVAEEVTQDTWLAVMRGIEHFEGRSSFKSWLFKILINRARTAAGSRARMSWRARASRASMSRRLRRSWLINLLAPCGRG